MNKKQENISVCSTLYLWNKISIRKPLAEISHIELFCFLFNVSDLQDINLAKVFHEKLPSTFFILTTRKL